MSFRHGMSKRHSRREFSSRASRVHGKNLTMPMRGGIRL